MKKPANEFFSRPRNLEETAAFLGCTPRYLRNEIYRGHLRARILSRNLIRLMPDDIRAWLDAAATTVEK